MTGFSRKASPNQSILIFDTNSTKMALNNSLHKKSGNLTSLTAVILLCIVALGYRINYSVFRDTPLQVTTWDALGYYYYLPGVFIHHDVKKLDWYVEAEKKYNLSGGDLYQYRELDNGNKVGKYFCGISIMQSPFFLLGHAYASISDYDVDGFSAPYQYAIAYGAVVYFILALFLLRRILLRYYDDIVVALTLLLLALGTNLLQYTAIDGSMSHSYIFLLYVLLLLFTIKWHEKPRIVFATLIGLTIGLAVCCRPTEAIMIFIPILWGIHNKETRKQKWDLVKTHRYHIIWAGVFGIIGIMPQLIYWKHVTGHFVYDVGSKWTFLNPWWRVLIGFEKGWFIYTPLTILFIISFFMMKKYEFRNSVLIFSLLNIWIVISWWDWQYGGTYSTRALVQSYPVMTLALGAFVTKSMAYKWRIPLAILGTYFVIVNLFQIGQYNSGIIHNRDMNFNYYKAIYMDFSPSPLDMSLLDTDERICDGETYKTTTLALIKDQSIECSPESHYLFFTQSIQPIPNEENWIKVQAELKIQQGYSDSHLSCEFITADSTKSTSIRLNNGLSRPDKLNKYEFHFRIPDDLGEGELRVSMKAGSWFLGEVEEVKIKRLVQ